MHNNLFVSIMGCVLGFLFLQNSYGAANDTKTTSQAAPKMTNEPLTDSFPADVWFLCGTSGKPDQAKYVHTGSPESGKPWRKADASSHFSISETCLKGPPCMFFTATGLQEGDYKCLQVSADTYIAAGQACTPEAPFGQLHIWTPNPQSDTTVYPLCPESDTPKYK